MKKIIISTTLTAVMFTSISAHAGLGPDANADLVVCKLEDGNNLGFVKLKNKYIIRVLTPAGDVVVDLTSDESTMMYSSSVETTAKGQRIGGRIVYIRDGDKNTSISEDYVDGKPTAMINYKVNYNGQAQYTANCLSNTITGEMMDDSLFYNMDAE